MQGRAPAPSGGSPPPPWLFALTELPFGVGCGFVASTMPYLTRQAGSTVAHIGWYGTVFSLATVLRLLYAPLLDGLLRRRTWLLALAGGSALLFATALTMPLPARLGWFLGLSFAAQLLSGLAGSCNAGLLAATVAERQRAMAAGWMNSGNLAGAALGAWLTLGLADGAHVPRPLVALLLFACTLGPALAVLRVPEAAPPAERMRARFRALAGDVVATLRARRGWTCLVICLSPVGSAALLNYATALAPDYGASPRLVALVSGPINALVVAAGALACGHWSHRLDRRHAYLGAGALTAACALGTMWAPPSPLSYAVGITAYLFASGVVYAAFSAMVLETIGRAGRSAATQYQVFASAANASMLYVGLIDTRFHQRWGSAGVLGADALMNLVGIATLLVLVRGRGARRLALTAAVDSR